MIHTAISGVIGSGGTSRRVGARLALGGRLRSGAAESGSHMLAAQRRAESGSRAQALLAVVQETVAGVRAASRLAGAGQ